MHFQLIQVGSIEWWHGSKLIVARETICRYHQLARLYKLADIKLNLKEPVIGFRFLKKYTPCMS
jgi:hypothetical protein